MSGARSRVSAGRAEAPFRLAAVIDVGATSVRMAIAQIGADGVVTTVEALQQAVNLGRDTFTRGFISRETTELCVEALRSFRAALPEYGIDARTQVRAVATSAVREAANRDTFLDRLYIGSEISVDVIDEAEVNRYTYLSVKPLIDAMPALKRRPTFIVEVGGGSTEFLILRRGEVAFSHSYRLGSLRMREALEDFHAPAARLPRLLESQIRHSVDQIRQGFSLRAKPNLLVLGGDARFAVAQLAGGAAPGGAVKIPVDALDGLAQQILALSVDDLVRRYHLSYPDAECLGPALLTYSRLAQTLGVSDVLVGAASLRDGLLAEMAGDPWSDEFARQILRSANEVARKYQSDLPHTGHVMRLARSIFEQTRELHRLSPRYELILMVAAVLHEVGLFISNRSHHKHSMYLIRNSEVFGFGTRDINLAALVARYHRRAAPKPAHEGYALLDRESRIAVCKLAAILRLADALDKAHDQRIQEVEVRVKRDRLVVTAKNISDLTLEQVGLQQKGSMFEDVYGLAVVLRAGGRGGGGE